MKTVFKIGLKCFLIATITLGFVYVLTPILREDKSSSAYQLRMLPEDTLDVLVLGSSHAQYSVNPGVIYTETGYYSYVLGSGCQPMVMSYYYLEEALKTQSPEVVLLDVFTMMPAQAVCYSDGMFYVAASQMTGDTRINAVKSIDNEEKINEYMYDLAINHDKWRDDDFTLNDFVDGRMGYVSQPAVEYKFHHLVPFERSDAEVTLKQKDVEALKNIIQLCRENDIRLILMKAAYDTDQKNYDTLHAIWDIADESGIEYLDFLQLAEEISFTFGMDGDTWHNNVWGAQKVSKYIAEYLKENDYIQKHEKHSKMEESMQKLKGLTAKWLFTDNIDIYQLMIFAQKYDLTMLVKYTGTEGYSSIGEYENQTLQSLGIKFDFHEQKHENYYAIIRNREVLLDGNNPIMMNFDGHVISIDDQEISVDKKVFTNPGELELIFIGNDFDWYHEMPIDYASKYFWRNECDSWSCTFHSIKNDTE